MLSKLAVGFVACVTLNPFTASLANARARVYVAPPPQIVEVVPPAPYPGAVWVGGYWDPVVGVWVPGHHEHPRKGFVFVQGGWVPTHRGWRYVPGHWRRG